MEVPDDSLEPWPQLQKRNLRTSEEIRTLKRKLLVLSFAVVAAACLSLTATGQVAPDRAPRTTTEPTYKYTAYAGFGYTSLNQVNQSRYGLMGVDAAVSRNWGRFFALTADGAYYWHPVSTGNPGNPNVSLVLFGPEVHGHIFERWSVFARGLLGGAHTGGEQQTPKVSFAGGFGGGVEYDLKPRWFIRVSGDDIASSFSLRGNTPALAYSPHVRRNSRASIGIGYRF